MNDILRLSFHKEPPTLDPQKSSDRLSSAIIFLLYKGLTRLESDQTIHCDLADSFYSQNNHQQYTFLLGRHHWSDQTPITAHDFVASWKRALSPSFSAPATNFFFHIKNAEKAKKGLLSLDKVGIRALNDQTLVIDLEHPCPYFPELTSFCPFFPIPSHVKEREIPHVFSGSFLLHEYNKKEIFLKKNPFCSKPPLIDGIQIKIIPDEKKVFSLFEKGELDWIGDPISPLPVAYLPSLVLNKKIQPLVGAVSCWFNTLIEPFSKPSARKALAHTIPRKALLEKLLLPKTLLDNNVCFFPQSGQSLFFHENEEAGKRLFNKALKELERDSLEITLTYEDTELFSRIGSILKGFWEARLPVRVQLEPLGFKELYQRLPSRQFQICLIRNMSQYTDVVNFLERFETKQSSRNFTGWENTKYQAMLKKYRKTTIVNSRQAIAKCAERLLVQESPITLLYYENYSYLQKPYLQNLTISPIGIVHFDRITFEKHRNPFYSKTLLDGDSCFSSQLFQSIHSHENEVDRKLFNELLVKLGVNHFGINLAYQDTDIFLKIGSILKRFWEARLPTHVQFKPMGFNELYQHHPICHFQNSLDCNLFQHPGAINFIKDFCTMLDYENIKVWDKKKYPLLEDQRATYVNNRQVSTNCVEHLLPSEIPITFLNSKPLRKSYPYNFAISPFGNVEFHSVALEKNRDRLSLASFMQICA